MFDLKFNSRTGDGEGESITSQQAVARPTATNRIRFRWICFVKVTKLLGYKVNTFCPKYGHFTKPLNGTFLFNTKLGPLSQCMYRHGCSGVYGYTYSNAYITVYTHVSVPSVLEGQDLCSALCLCFFRLFKET